MANTFNENIEALLSNVDGYLNSKTVVGEPVQAGENLIIPLAEVSFGIGAGAFDKDTNKSSGGGGLGAKITPTAVLVVNKSGTKLVNVKSSDAVSKIMDMVPDIINKFTGKAAEKTGPSHEAEDSAEFTE